MSRSHAIARVLLFLAGFLMVGAPDAWRARDAQAAAAPVIHPGAVLDVTVWAAGKKELEFTATVAPDSTIMVPLAGTTKVGGLEATRVQQRLQTVFGKTYFVDPQVLVNIKEYGGRVLVSGEVRQPGIYPMGLGLTALSATVIAGGFTDFASAGRAKVVRTLRNGRTEVLYIDLGRVLKGQVPDLALRDGDRVDVPRRLF
jgi:polysaccharide export outer membrane protein